MPVRIAAAVAVLSLICAPAALADGTLSVDGSGRVMVTPDVASTSMSVSRLAMTSSAALSAANRRVGVIVAAVRAVGVPAIGIQTNSINVSVGTIRVGPRHHKRRVRRYTASESLSITSRAVIVGPVIDAAIRAGAGNVYGPNFSFSDPSAGAVAATNAAVADARARADSAAAMLGYKVTGVQSINLDPQSNVVLPGSGGTPPAPVAVKAPAPTHVHPGAQEVDATVAVVFTIAPV